MRQTQRSGQTPENVWSEITTGDTPNSIEVSTTAKGAAQISVKLYYASPDDAITRSADDLHDLLSTLASTLAKHGIPMAGQQEVAGNA